jgi:hypothetical protein
MQIIIYETIVTVYFNFVINENSGQLAVSSGQKKINNKQQQLAIGRCQASEKANAFDCSASRDA